MKDLPKLGQFELLTKLCYNFKAFIRPLAKTTKLTNKLKGKLNFMMTLPNSQRNSWNLYIINNVEDIVVFLNLNVKF